MEVGLKGKRDEIRMGQRKTRGKERIRGTKPDWTGLVQTHHEKSLPIPETGKEWGEL